jgi:LAO/AO transport system kinase
VAGPHDDPTILARAVLEGASRAVARAISWLEAGDRRGAQVLATARRARGEHEAWWVGVTGAPGSGKSTLVDRLVEAWRAQGEAVAVLAVDPSSPLSGGALLGDRIRMTRWHDDAGVFVRSMSARGRLGGLATATVRAAALLEAAGYQRIVIETVGVGQSEVDVAAAADTTLLVLAPGAGDDVQAVKAGVSEIADVLIVNKCDLPGAERLRRDLAAAQGLVPAAEGAWRPPIVSASAHEGTGLPDVVAAVAAQRAWREAREDRAARRLRRAEAELGAALKARAERMLRSRPEAWLAPLVAGEVDAEELAERLLPAGGSDTDDAVASEP